MINRIDDNPESSQPTVGVGMVIPEKHEELPTIDAVWLGGTIGSVSQKNADGKNFLSPGLTGPEFEEQHLVKTHVAQWAKLRWTTPSGFPETGLDSTNLTEDQMQRVALQVFAILKRKFESGERGPGIIIAQGTDSMDYMATYLSLAIQNPHCGVVLTGAQIKPDSPHTDAMDNFALATRIADSDFAETGVAFAGTLWRGSGVKKIEAVAREHTFDTPHLHHLASLIGESVQWFDHPVPRRRGKNGNMTADERCSPPYLYQTLSGSVRIIPMSPYFAEVSIDQKQRSIDLSRTRIFKEIMQGAPDAAVIAGYAAGNIPLQIAGVLETISKNVSIIVAPSASTRGMKEEIYEVSPKISHPSLIFAEGLTPATAALKYRWLLARAESLKTFKKLKPEDIKAWVASRFSLPIAREIPPVTEGGSYVPATVVRDFIESADIFTEGLSHGKTEDILRLHRTLIEEQRRRFWENCTRKMEIPQDEATEWQLDRRKVLLPIGVDCDAPKKRLILSESVADPHDEIFGPLWNSEELIGEDLIDGMQKLCKINRDRVVQVLQEWGCMPQPQRIVISSDYGTDGSMRVM